MFNPESYVIASKLIVPLIGIIYLFTFISFLFQMRGLFGKEGILSIQNYLKLVRNAYQGKAFYYCPSLFWINASDFTLLLIPSAGIVLSLLLILGIMPPLLLLLLFLCFLSIVTTGQDFLSFIWDVFLLEITFNLIFLTLTTVPNPFIWISLNLLLFRFHIEVGVVKLHSRDPNWWNLSALSYHYETQPLPNTLAWFAHQMPLWFHKVSCASMFIIELIVPFGIFGPDIVRLGTCILLVGLQTGIWITGNFAFLNLLTTFLCVILISDRFFIPWIQPPPIDPVHPALHLTLSVIGLILILLQLMQLINHFIPNRYILRILSWVAPFHTVNRYGLFAIMTTERYEIIPQGSNDGENWKDYLFYWKPGPLDQRPKRISPLHPRLDWQCWFLPFRHFQHNAWFQNFLIRLLEGAKPVLRLLKHNPFPDQPPKYIRAVKRKYNFTTTAERKNTGNWWKSSETSLYSPTYQKKD